MALDHTYFRGELHLPNLVYSHNPAPMEAVRKRANETDGEYSLQRFIAKYEPRFLISLLGYELYEAYKDGINAESPLPVWLELQAKIYREEQGIKFSPAANYVYFFVRRAGLSQTTLAGEMKVTGANKIDSVTATRKMVSAWNSMICDVHDIRHWIRLNAERINEAAGKKIYYSCCFNEFCEINIWDL